MFVFPALEYLLSLLHSRKAPVVAWPEAGPASVATRHNNVQGAYSGSLSRFLRLFSLSQ